MSDIPREFVFTRYPGRQGMVWLRTAYVMFSKHRAAWLLVFMGYLAILLVFGALPYVGSWLVPIANPVFAVGILAAAWNEERGARPTLNHLLQGFHSNVWALVAIGIFLLAGLTLAGYASFLVDGGKLAQLRASTEPMTEEQLLAQFSDRQFQLGFILSTLIAVPIVIVSWWASALVVFQDATATAAIATSLRAGLANWKALCVYVLGLLMYGAFVPSLIIVVVSLIVPPPALQLLLILIVLPYFVIFVVTFHVSYYVSYRDVFHANETLAPLSRNI